MDKVAELLEKLATELGVTVQYLWPILVKQIQIKWIATIGTLGVVACIWCVVWVKYRKQMFLEWTEQDNPVPAIIFFSVALGLMVALAGTIIEIDRLFVPEAEAFKRLLESLGGN